MYDKNLTELNSLAYEQGLCEDIGTTKWRVFQCFMVNSSVLSVLGSATVIFMILRRSRKKDSGETQKVAFQNHLLLPLSLFDIIGSIGWGFSTLPIPKGSACTFMAFGNRATCITQGFMILLGHCTPMYNGALCVYYLLVVKFNVKDQVFVRYEPLIHAACILPPLFTAIVAMSNNLINNHAIACLIVDSNHYIPSSAKNNHENLTLSILYAGSLIIMVSLMIVIVYCMYTLYKFVEDKDQTMSTYEFPAARQKKKTSTVLHDTKIQAFLYVISFFLTYIPSSILILIDVFFQKNTPYPMNVIFAILSPLQGFWNCLAYIRPRLAIISKKHKGKSVLSRLFITILYKPEERRGYATLRRGRGSVLRSNKKRKKKRAMSTKKASKYAKECILDKSQEKSRHHVDDQELSRQHHTVGNITHDQEQLSHDRHHGLIRNDLVPDDDFCHIDEVVQDSPLYFNEACASVEGGNNLDFLYADNDKVEEQSWQEYFPDDNEHILYNYQEAVTLSLLIAEDILPKSLASRYNYMREQRPRHRLSMIDRFPLELEESQTELESNNKDDSLIGDVDATARVSTPSFFNLNLRRHSCPDISNINKEENK